MICFTLAWSSEVGRALQPLRKGEKKTLQKPSGGSYQSLVFLGLWLHNSSLCLFLLLCLLLD
uniref:Uncharacterized protein n=1 Tax=Sus scrofa TaxID=9823 RepID=A0A8D0XGL3_PIG